MKHPAEMLPFDSIILYIFVKTNSLIFLSETIIFLFNFYNPIKKAAQGLLFINI